MVTNLDLAELIENPATEIILCCGSGGVGKTTTAAALAIAAAEAGRRVAVITIDPAQRLAQALGLTNLDNTPRLVADVCPEGPGQLFAMMLDMKRTFDDVVQAHTTAEKAQQILANPFYQALSSSFAGTQEYMAMEKLGQLRADPQDRWDLIVVDTPPSRSALDFLDAPSRLGSFLDGTFIRLISAPAKLGSRAYLKAFSMGLNAATSAVTKILGAQILRDVQTFVAALDTMFGGFRERADATYRLLSAPGTAFLVVATPERDALREASYFVDRLSRDQMPLAGLLLNRVQPALALDLSADRVRAAAELLARQREHLLTTALLRLHAEQIETRQAQRARLAGFSRAHPEVPIRELRDQPGDVHDLPGLRAVGQELLGDRPPVQPS